MGHLGALSFLVAVLSWRYICGRSLSPCQEQLEFRCSDGRCIPRLSVCNGSADCEDGSDEQHCAPAGCASSEFRCGDGKCISLSWRCDFSPDCADESDEDHCDQNECLINNGGCSHLCVDQTPGFFCDCPKNMKLIMENQCEEIDVCLESDVCDQSCVHVNSSFTCDCHEGYQSSPATGECKAKDLAQLVFSTSKGLQWMNISSTKYTQLVSHLPGSGPVSAFAQTHTLYWAWQGQGSIFRISLDGKSQDDVLLLKVQGSVSSLAVDWIHQLLYWTSMDKGSVNIALLHSSTHHRRLITGLDEPSAITVEPLQGFVFWAESGSSPKIERASLDGQNRMALVTSSIRRPVALSLDMPRQLLYWADEGMRSISRVNFNGYHRKTVIESNGYLDRPYGLAVFEGFVYWSDKVTHTICRGNKHNGSHLQVLVKNISSPGGVVIVQPLLQPSGLAVCGSTGLMCKDKCVIDLMSHTPRFICTPAGMEKNGSQEIPTQSRSVPASALFDPTFTGILSLFLFLSILVGVTLWWWRCFRYTSTLTVQSLSFKESQHVLLQKTPEGPDTCPVKETLLKPDLDRE
ncbi:low-density lipoprotein receptor-like isoform X2 [Thalassophryne amazonica]|uniref:low-density lipoprotein receptor-like isoform X2 n=1 Tax=Thalassophryne amazonica TaxID=390379 RepID=UPI0014712D81|nr:low-density lipoprotein receptor-like isoform X2 [Thalassophryne amazonica]